MQANYYHRSARPLTALQKGDHIMMQIPRGTWLSSHVTSILQAPRSYLMQTEDSAVLYREETRQLIKKYLSLFLEDNSLVIHNTKNILYPQVGPHAPDAKNGAIVTCHLLKMCKDRCKNAKPGWQTVCIHCRIMQNRLNESCTYTLHSNVSVAQSM